MKKIFIALDNNSKYNNLYRKAFMRSDVTLVTDITKAGLCDALALCGGGDINPVIYGQENTESRKIDNNRDSYELELFKLFYHSSKPIFGICRGHQLINVALEGTLIQNIKTGFTHTSVSFYEYTTHKITSEKGSILYKIHGDEFIVNSFHHQCIGKRGNGLKIIARSSVDNIPEAVVHTSKPIISVQWHPERMLDKKDECADEAALYDYFLSLI